MPPANATAPNVPPDERHPISLLNHFYLALGLPLPAASAAAIADFECMFEASAAHLCVP